MRRLLRRAFDLLLGLTVASPVLYAEWDTGYPKSDASIRIARLLAACSLAACLIVARKLKKVIRLADGCCPNCGYDLLATPGRCPECGAVPKAAR